MMRHGENNGRKLGVNSGNGASRAKLKAVDKLLADAGGNDGEDFNHTVIYRRVITPRGVEWGTVTPAHNNPVELGT